MTRGTDATSRSHPAPGREWGALHFRVLGPLDVLRDNDPVRIGAAKQRALLACLLLRPNQVVSVDELIDCVWTQVPPLGARNALHTYVSRLRGQLRTAIVASRPGGYLLTASADTLDLLHMGELDADAARAAQAGDLVAEAEALDLAVRLWRGDELVDVTSARLHAELVPRLVEQRLRLLERRADVWLRLGRHDELTAHLAELTRAYPLRERFWAQRMRALAQAGRLAEALHVYHTVARVLSDELGVDPGAELRSLHASALRGDDCMPGGPPSTMEIQAPAARLVPRQLPADVMRFTGRDKEIHDVAQLLERCTSGDAGPVTIDGMGGIGKSALAIRAAHGLADRFPDGQLYVDLRGATAGVPPLDPLHVLGRFLRSLGAADAQVPDDLAEAAARFRSLVAGRRVLVVLDDARDAAQVRSLLPASTGCAVLVTSRRVLAELDGAHHLHLDVLTEAESVHLLAQLAGPERIAAAPRAAALISLLCGHLPLALRIVGARLTARPSWPLDALANRLADARRRLDELCFGELTARASIQVTYDTLTSSADEVDRAAARTFRMLGLPDGPDISTAIAARLLDEPVPVVEQHLERLADAQLLSSTTPGRYHLHDLLRLFAREEATRVEPEREQRAAIERVWRCYVATAPRVGQLLRKDHLRDDPDPHDTLPSHTQTEALAWADAESANLVAAAHQASVAPFPLRIMAV